MKCAIRKKFYLELDLIVNWLKCKNSNRTMFPWENQVSTPTAQVNFFTISILRGWSSKSCGDFSILLFVASQFSYLICLSISKNGIPWHSFFYSLMAWESFGQISRQFVEFSYLINLFKEGTLAEKRGRNVFFASKVLDG